LERVKNAISIDYRRENKMFNVKVFLKGMLMGICDTVPGISGGTIAFITGIYEKLINSIKGFSFLLIFDLILFIFGKGDRRKLKKDISNLNLGFLITLLSGIVMAIFIFSRVMSFLLERHFAFTMVFFVGLIIASAKTIFKHIEKHHSANVVLAFFGLILGVSLAFLVPSVVEPSLGYVFLGGFLAISAMMLPGISGSFILLVIGIYGFMLNVVKNIFSNFDYIVVFVLGAVVGLFSISRVVSYLFKKDKSKILYFLLGLVVGSLSVPIRNIYSSGFYFNFINSIAFAVLFVLGVIAGSSVTRFSKERYLVNKK
jgi:putative membrane protein